ncbi:hypothetical protein [Endozoicomonas sp.]|uniref:hypothetical protein n=1 Tax=Endozoicomonas sp. TaxID=1892382 RepID=UPI00383A2E18
MNFKEGRKNTMEKIIVTKEEQRAIRALKRLAKKWPDSISLFSWSGTLCVMKRDSTGLLAEIDAIQGIDNDGGCPGYETEVNKEVEIEYA